MYRPAMLLLALALMACTEAPPQAASPAPGAVHYHLRQGSQLLSCVTSGFDTICRNA